MQSTHLLSTIRTLHTLIYLLMASSVIYLFIAGCFGVFNVVTVLALIVVGMEVMVFTGNGFKCPLTALAVKYGAEKGYAFDTWLPEKATRYTFRFFGALLLLALLLLAGHWFFSL